jgi:hypothetical protein
MEASSWLLYAPPPDEASKFEICCCSSSFSCSSINLAKTDPGAAPAPHAPPDPTLMSTKSVFAFFTGPCVANSSPPASFASCSFVVWFSSFLTRTGPATGAFSSSSSSVSSPGASAFSSSPALASPVEDMTATATFGACFFGRLGLTGTMEGSGCRFCRLASISSCRIISCCSAYSNQSSSVNP